MTCHRALAEGEEAHMDVRRVTRRQLLRQGLGAAASVGALSAFPTCRGWVRLEKNAGAEADDLVLGRVIVPVSPKIGEKLVLREGKGTFLWSVCPGAAKYELSIVDPANGRMLLSHETKTASAALRLELRQGRTYQWRIQALDAGGEYLGGSPGKGGEAWTFQL